MWLNRTPVSESSAGLPQNPHSEWANETDLFRDGDEEVRAYAAPSFVGQAGESLETLQAAGVRVIDGLLGDVQPPGMLTFDALPGRGKGPAQHRLDAGAFGQVGL